MFRVPYVQLLENPAPVEENVAPVDHVVFHVLIRFYSTFSSLMMILNAGAAFLAWYFMDDNEEKYYVCGEFALAAAIEGYVNASVLEQRWTPQERNRIERVGFSLATFTLGIGLALVHDDALSLVGLSLIVAIGLMHTINIERLVPHVAIQDDEHADVPLEHPLLG